MYSKLILGTAQFGLNYGISNKRGKIPQKEVYEILKFAWGKKIRLLDTASGYGKSEKIIGEFIKKNKFNFKIISGEFKGCNSHNLEKHFFKSLKKLNQKKIYGYLIHNFDHFLQDKNIWKVLINLKSKGKIQKIGYSLYLPEQLNIIFKQNIKPDIVQVPYNFFDQRFASFFNQIKKRNIRIYARSIFLQGLIFIKPKSLKKLFKKIKTKIILLNQLAKENKLSIASLAINFALLNKNIDKIIYGIDSIKNLQENIRVIKDKNKVKKVYQQLLNLKEKDGDIILPINWH